jgi:hypothetical protein
MKQQYKLSELGIKSNCDENGNRYAAISLIEESQGCGHVWVTTREEAVNFKGHGV